MRHSWSSSVATLTLLWIFYSFTPVLASLSNITVDDTGSGIQYAPSSLWNDGSNCKACTARPDVTKASGGTWHDSTHQSSSNEVSFASLQFTGSAVYVFCIIAHSSVSPDGNTDMTFFIDGQQVGTFVLAPTGQNVYEYNVPVYVNTSMSSGTHTITIQNGRPGGAKSLILLDSIVFTTGEADTIVVPTTQPTPETVQLVTTSLILATPTVASPLITNPTNLPSLPPFIASQSLSSSPSSTSISTDFRETVTAVFAPTSQIEGSSSPSTQGLAPSSSGAANAAANADDDTKQKSRATIIAAVVPSVIALLLIIGALIFIYMRRHRKQHDYYAPQAEPQIANDPEASGWAQDTWNPRGQGSDMQTVMSPSSFTAVSAALFSASGASESTGTAKNTPVVAPASQVGTGRSVARMTMSSVSSASVYSASDQDHAPLPIPPYADVGPSPLSAVTEESMLVSATSSQHPYAIRTPIATTPEPDFYADAQVPAVPEPPVMSKAEEAGMFPVPPPLPPLPLAGSRPLPTRPAMTRNSSRSTQVRRTNTSITSDVPPAYENISRDDAVRL